MPSATIIPFQTPLPQVLPPVVGNVDYRHLCELLSQIERLLVFGGLEAKLVEADLEAWAQRAKLAGPRAQQTRQLHCRRALRCNLARALLKEHYRPFAARLADSPLLQRFCGIGEVDRIRVPGKSTLQRYDEWWPQAKVRAIIEELLRLAAEAPARLGLPAPVDLESVFMDTTCLEANIHYPVDWVLFRDATRTLIKSVRLIRAQGLKHRMEEPERFLTRINGLCMQMTHAWNKADSRRQRKKTLRQMDRVAGAVRAHAQRYRDLLAARWSETAWSQAQAGQVLGRMDRVLAQLPQARAQARQRILEEKLVDNAAKILSLYEADVHVIVRRKAGAEVEFGNTLFLAENPLGLIVDWELFQESAPADTALLPRSIGRMEAAYGPRLKEVTADRGFDCQTNQVGLERERIYNAVCPRDPQELERRAGSWKFKRLQRRRAQTEGRVAIMKNVFWSGRLRRKGFAHRELTVTWTVLVHNLWVLARLKQRSAKTAEARAA